MLKLPDIRRVHIELTTRCNARCPMCMRNYRGSDYNSGYPDTELNLDHIKKIFKPRFVSQLERVNFNGNLGDFALARDAREIVEFFVDNGVRVDINTNGSLRSESWWASLAHPLVTVGWAIDGLADTHSLYRQDTDWHRVTANARSFIAAGGKATWRFIPFAHNLHQQQDCEQLSRDWGFWRFENIWDGRDRGPVYTRSGDFSHNIGEPYEQTPTRVEPLRESHITWYDARTIQHERDRSELNLFCVHKKNQEIYLAADGSVYPCCYLGFYPDTMHHPGNAELRELVAENNALEYPLEHCLNWFDSVESSWSKPSIREGRTYQCVASCNRP
jgi:sulfatase maturation enzyme AslB (radical SAM superfamily)